MGFPQNAISIDFTKEEIRIIHQALNEVCNGIHFEDGEFETRMGTDRETACQVMANLSRHYRLGVNEQQTD